MNKEGFKSPTDYKFLNYFKTSYLTPLSNWHHGCQCKFIHLYEKLQKERF